MHEKNLPECPACGCSKLIVAGTNLQECTNCQVIIEATSWSFNSVTGEYIGKWKCHLEDKK